MNDSVEQRLDRLGEQAGAGAGPPPPAALLDALRRRRAERATQRVFSIGASTLVVAAAGITLVVLFGGPPARQPVAHMTPGSPIRHVPASTYAVAHGWTVGGISDVVSTPSNARPVAPPNREDLLSVGSIHDRHIADGLLSSF